MGREIKRVPLDFDWQLEQVWEGYLNPYSRYSLDCPLCDGSGLSDYALALDAAWYNFDGQAGVGIAKQAPEHPNKQALIAFCEQFVTTTLKRGTLSYDKKWCHQLEQCDVDALWDSSRLFDFRDSYTTPPPVDIVNVWSHNSFGHDAINRYIVVKNRCKAWGVEYLCSECDGHGEQWINSGYKHLYDTWNDIEPPVGEGWQLWETVSDGSPISPVFKDEFDFEEYLIQDGYSVSAVQNFLKLGFAFSMVLDTGSGEIKSDIETLSD